MNIHRKILHIGAVSIIAFATLLMLAPTILPHHHDGAAVCFCANPHSHDCDSHSHNHSTHTDTDAPCTLTINYYSSDIERKDKIIESITIEDSDDDRHHLHTVFCYLEHCNREGFITLYSPLPADDTPHTYHSPAGEVHSLRAPPVFS